MARPSFLFAPGAGAPSLHPWMQHWRELLQTSGDVTLLDYDYMRARRKPPDPPSQLISAHRRALAKLRATANSPVFLVGKSMGGRIGCHVALEDNVAGVICLGYPLCGCGDPAKLRDKVLRELRTPILFVQGTRDPLCPLELLERVRTEMTAPNFLHVVEDGDHSLRVSARHLRSIGETQDASDARVLAAIAEFVGRTMPT
jgi:predicted alpha/beta-hydrolase family hydrolase